MRYRRQEGHFVARLLSILIASIIMFGVVSTLGFWKVFTVEIFTATLQKTVVDRGETKFVFLREDTQTLEIIENEDSLWFFKFNSGNILRDLEVGKTYRITVAGLRIPLFSMYRNIIEFH